LRTDPNSIAAETVAGSLGRSPVQVRSERVNAPLIIADVRGPNILDFLGMLAGIQHAPAINTYFAVGKRNRCQFHAHAVKSGHKSFNVKIRHFRFPLKRCQTFYAS